MKNSIKISFVALMFAFSFEISSGGECEKENEEYKSCGTACPLHCENYTNPGPCTLQCVPGCQCKEGYVRKDGFCVEPAECG